MHFRYTANYESMECAWVFISISGKSPAKGEPLAFEIFTVFCKPVFLTKKCVYVLKTAEFCGILLYIEGKCILIEKYTFL